MSIQDNESTFTIQLSLCYNKELNRHYYLDPTTSDEIDSIVTLDGILVGMITNFDIQCSDGLNSIVGKITMCDEYKDRSEYIKSCKLYDVMVVPSIDLCLPILDASVQKIIGIAEVAYYTDIPVPSTYTHQ